MTAHMSIVDHRIRQRAREFHTFVEEHFACESDSELRVAFRHGFGKF